MYHWVPDPRSYLKEHNYFVVNSMLNRMSLLTVFSFHLCTMFFYRCMENFLCACSCKTLTKLCVDSMLKKRHKYTFNRKRINERRIISNISSTWQKKSANRSKKAFKGHKLWKERKRIRHFSDSTDSVCGADKIHICLEVWYVLKQNIMFFLSMCHCWSECGWLLYSY